MKKTFNNHKKLRFIPLLLTTTIVNTTLIFSAKADMAKVRCIFYPQGEDKASLSTICDFSQRQGNVGITKPNGVRYDFRVSDQSPTGYIDNNNQPVNRQNSEDGIIFRTKQESIYIYWDTQNTSNSSNNSQPNTVVTNPTMMSLDIKITDKNFTYQGKLPRKGREFMGSNGKVRVLLDPYDGHIIVFSEYTGEELYNYYINPVSGVGEDPATMCNPEKESC